ncbi:MAG: RnfABCDGE type electron transport complex subunit C, partial [Sphaerochaetaceae bacterium]|nr:RnfABCDGE type electron transport complex subunit C [Sphaerochaetaceae bacterium]
MPKYNTFSKGGVHPNDKKYLSKESPLERLPMPGELVVAMSQHLGAPATPLKVKGDRVVKGEKIGQASSFISADVHSPVSGIVTDTCKVTLATSIVCDALVITPDEEQPEMFTQKLDYSGLTGKEILGKIKDFGIVGLGGATFPAHVKMSIPEGKSVKALVINGVECEPYLNSDYRLMMEHPSDVAEGAFIAAKVLNPEKIIIGVEANKLDGVESLRNAIKEKGYNIEVMPLKMKYPQGDEKQLLKATIGREIPSGKLPLDVGAVVLNIGTTYAIYNAIAYEKPLIERIVSVTGEAINRPCNVIAPIGTKVKYLVDFAG